MNIKLKEIWAWVVGYEKLYEVSSMGNVRSVKRSGSKGLSLKTHPSKGYLQVWLSKNNKVKKFSAHRLVALAFIENPLRKPEVNHKDGNKTNNKIENLEWVTKSENEAHKKGVLGHTGIGEKNANFGHKKAKLYPNEELRNRLCELGVPRYKHNLAELGEMLGKGYWMTKLDEIWMCKIRQGGGKHFETADTEANARAKMLIYLLEKGLIFLPFNYHDSEDN